MKNAIKHPSISGMLTQLTDNHECSGNVTEYRAAVIKGAVMPLCDAGKQKLEAIHPPQNLVRQ